MSDDKFMLDRGKHRLILEDKSLIFKNSQKVIVSKQRRWLLVVNKAARRGSLGGLLPL